MKLVYPAIFTPCLEKNGYTTISEDWDKNMDETLKIIKTKWVDND